MSGYCPVTKDECTDSRCIGCLCVKMETGPREVDLQNGPTIQRIRKEPAKAASYPHYYRKLPVGATHVDVYRVLDLFEVKRSSVAHAIKKLLCTGRRGAKGELRDLEEARDSIDRAIEMLKEEET